MLNKQLRKLIEKEIFQYESLVFCSQLKVMWTVLQVPLLTTSEHYYFLIGYYMVYSFE